MAAMLAGRWINASKLNFFSSRLFNNWVIILFFRYKIFGGQLCLRNKLDGLLMIQ
ncbi:hypothetical protein A1OE_349 [Candidatus Endolissoclinum faulkneri L2]|uniref:Uncharacterized protein n=1 Tax=Candidatus Endolissoclinum faulkneri L2 TaxID=1193729 RepID=K7YPP5_9PROT|nr:hypothetical protein A1OE_349 [Candidatus Endolissoclinum faulkneri L2]